jgi:hypothetical protein
MEAVRTANSMFEYKKEFFGIPLDTWVQETHKYHGEKYGWKHYPLKKGSFGYDNLAVSIGYALTRYVPDKEELAKNIHKGWCMNYIYWRDEKPQETNPDDKYIAPYTPLNDERRNLCAQTDFFSLEKEEQDKDYIIAEFIQLQLQTS